MRVSGNIVDVFRAEIYPGTLLIHNGRIIAISRDAARYDNFIVPGLVDAHVHIESSMLVPTEFARLAVIHGTVAAVSDPHEIANVLGVEGVRFMVENGKLTPFNFYFGAPSCVPATAFETAGACLCREEIESLLDCDEILYLSEMMNFPAVINRDREVMGKIDAAKALAKPIDGHAPGLRGEALRGYIDAGISTDHETYRLEEGEEKLSLGMKLIIREGSAAKNFDVLSPLIRKYPEQCMLCSDDKHPDDLVVGHINDLIKRGLREGMDLMTMLRCATVNPVKHYGLDVGLLRIDDYADFIEIDSLTRFNVIKTYIKGNVVAENGSSLLPHVSPGRPNRFRCGKKAISDFAVRKRGRRFHVIEAINRQVITGSMTVEAGPETGSVNSDPERDLLKLVVVNRYRDSRPAIGFVKNFGLKSGAIASSVAHDSHNIVAVGVRDEDICEAVNMIIEAKGGLSAVCDTRSDILSLPVAGLMSDDDGAVVAGQYSQLDRFAKQLGSFLDAPFMTLSFMALLVIPRLKMSDRGLFDGENFSLIELFE